MSVRHCVVCDPNGPLIDGLRRASAPGWTFHHVLNLPAAQAMARDRECMVGLVALGSSSAEHAGLEALLAQGRSEWIAVVERGYPASPGFGKLLDAGLHDFHTRPVDLSRLIDTMGHAHGKAVMRSRSRTVDAGVDRFGMIGASPAMLELYRLMEKVVRAQAPVLLTGESGTGKELVAHAIHQHSSRRDGPFVAINCGALPSTLIQSELFGYDRGAFTGALRNRTGGIEAADGGVLFLDEIADLPLEQQTNLLRFLQDKSIVRLGSTQRIDVDVRVVAATNVDLQTAVDAGRFRADLFYRLNVLHLKLPPLRARGKDTARLAEHSFDLFRDQKSPQVRGFSADALRAISEHDWPGNVRELVNRVQQAMILTENRLITPADLSLQAARRTSDTIRLEDARATVDRDLLERTLRRHRNNVSQAARQLGVSRVTVYRMMNRHNISV